MSHSNEYYNGQALQDKFVLEMLNYKRDGFFLELGSNEPCKISNTYLLEKDYNWTGIMIDYEQDFLPLYQTQRRRSTYVIGDATAIDYVDLLQKTKCPLNADYLQIDLEPGNGSTLKALQNLDKNVFDNYKFAVVTFEHDICNGGTHKDSVFHLTRTLSREIFERRGYVRVFNDINNYGWWELEERRTKVRNGETVDAGKIHNTTMYPFEDWYVHPDLVDISRVKAVVNKNVSNYVQHPECGTTINYAAIEY
jgi:hypothetical protein